MTVNRNETLVIKIGLMGLAEEGVGTAQLLIDEVNLLMTMNSARAAFPYAYQTAVQSFMPILEKYLEDTDGEVER